MSEIENGLEPPEEMNKNVAKALRREADKQAAIFSNPKRLGNTNKETYRVHDIHILSEAVAAVVFIKNTGKKALMLSYYRRDRGNEHWISFFPTDSHILGLQYIDRIKLNVERDNFRADNPMDEQSPERSQQQ